MKRVKSIFLFIQLFIISVSIYAQDSLVISLDEAQKIFQEKNLTLVIQKFNIEASKAQTIQARLFSNPTVSAEQGLHSQQAVANNEVIAPFGQHAIQIQKLFLLAGKRNKNIQMARMNEKISEYEFFDIARTLTYSLSSNFFSLAFQLETIKVYKEEISTIERLVVAYKQLQKDGNASLKDVVRLESFLFSLKSNLNNLELSIAETQSELRVLLSIKNDVNIIPKINKKLIEAVSIENYTLTDLVQTAEENRFDIRIQESNINMANINLRLQKSYRTPDLMLGYTYDKAGSYINNYHAITLQATLPFFNRNQGNVKTAEYQLKMNEASLEQSRISLSNEVLLAYTQTKKTEALYQNFDKQFVSNFNTLIQGVIKGYEKKTISLLEFTDFFESYKENVEQINSLENNRIQSYLKLNFGVAKSIFNLY